MVEDWHGSKASCSQLHGALELRVFFVGLTPLQLLPKHLEPRFVRSSKLNLCHKLTKALLPTHRSRKLKASLMT